MKKIFIIILLLPFSAISQNQHFKIIKSAYLKCFDTVVYKKNGKPYTSEPSTVSYYRGSLFVGNDKTCPFDYSSIFAIKFTDSLLSKNITYTKDQLYKNVKKFESSTITADSNFFIFSGAYSWAEHKKYNRAIFFSTKNPQKGDILQVENGKEIREKLLKAIENKETSQKPDYIKVEGLAALPDNHLLFGIREMGKTYKDFKYTITIVEAKLKTKGNKLLLSNKFKKIYHYKPDSKYGDIGLSAMEYNPYDSCLYVVSSVEKGTTSKDLGAYLWKIKLDDLYKNKPLTPILDQNNNHFRFNHKIEGLTFVAPNKILLIADDDRVCGENEENPSFRRTLNEFYWYLIELY